MKKSFAENRNLINTKTAGAVERERERERERATFLTSRNNRPLAKGRLLLASAEGKVLLYKNITARQNYA